MGFLLQRPPLLIIDKKQILHAHAPRRRAPCQPLLRQRHGRRRRELAREKPLCHWIRRPEGAACRRERGRNHRTAGSGDLEGPHAAGSEGVAAAVPVPMSRATGYGDREETHAAESEGEAARINLNGFGAEPVRRSRE